MNTTSTASTSDPVVAVHDDRAEAELSLRALRQAGFDLKKLSIIGKGYYTEEHARRLHAVGDRERSWGYIGGIWGVLTGSAVFLVPYVGLVIVAGPFLHALAAALESAVIVGGLSAFGAALLSLGMSKDRAIQYEADLKADRFLVIVQGTAEDIARARANLAVAPGAAGVLA